MEASQVLDSICQEKAVAIVRGVLSKDMTEVVKALKHGGITNVEVTFNHNSDQGMANTLESIRRIREEFGDSVNVGAGTVLSPREVEQAVGAGAEYIISPNTNVDVIKRTKELGKISIPGALSPSEACLAWESGADIVKMFPAGALGVSYLKAVSHSLSHIPLCAVGGITVENVEDFLKAGIRCFGIGGNLVSPEIVKNGEFQRIQEEAGRYRKVLERY